MDQTQLSSAVEAILFAADRPITIERLKEVLSDDDKGPSPEDILESVKKIQERFLCDAGGFELREAQGGYQFYTKIAHAPLIQKFLATKPFRLGRSALEALSIIAYRQPITRAEVDQIRGIDSSHLMRVLMERGLVRMVGKAEIPGRPVVYGTTPRFLETIGLGSLSDLPPLTELDQLQGDSEDPVKAMEAGLEKFVQTTETAMELQAQATEGLQEIEGLIDSAGRGDKEVFQSKLHAEVAAENQAALDAFQSSPRRRKKTVRYEELTAAPAEPETPELSSIPTDETVN